MNQLPSILPITALDDQHSEYKLHSHTWKDIGLLYRGGGELKRQCALFLQRRIAEPQEVFQERCRRFDYQDIMGTGLGWYQSAMFSDTPEIAQRDAGGNVSDSVKDEFFADLLTDCDNAGTPFVDFSRKVFLTSVLYKSAFVLVDLPGSDAPSPAAIFASRADQRKAGALDAYFVLYEPSQVINWEADRFGNLEWCVIADSREERAIGKTPKVIDVWYYFDRQQFAVYEAERLTDNSKADTARLVDSGPHSMSALNRVPVRRIAIPDALWLANRVYLNVVAHLNLQNAFEWGLLMACLPVLYIKGEYTESPKVSETAWIHLPDKDSAIGYVEPGGAAYKTTSEQIAALREEIYRQMYLQSQGRSTKATASAQSGYSKEMDMAPAQDVLAAFGDILRAAMVNLLDDIAEVRGDTISFDVRGFDFDRNGDVDEIETAALLSDLSIPSDTLQKEMFKRVARKYLQDAPPTLVALVEQEIDKAPKLSEKQALNEAQRLASITANLRMNAVNT